ncbi:VOC family protein [Deinococcus multiflagellatus]|uniref:VOC family protein n=1 Tax=Deinococcus multiflagellatus TaxID=1656887 RepID=A0ABW1ZMX3_9DEIO|nr:VOC family protein [Deinococcus multiflagellatus]MBZ9715186.1 VOC family protein [Deinococcus multiflagellatus]
MNQAAVPLTTGPLTLGPVELTVADLPRAAAFYRQVLGLTVLEDGAATATLGRPGLPLVRVSAQPGARPAQPTSPGLYHLALLLPTRADLARWVQHAASLGVRLGQSDHLVSEAFYLHDPDGHGIEVYRDRPRSEWRWTGGQVQMAGDPIDLPGLLAEPDAQRPFAGLPEGTSVGHVHLRVTDLGDTEAFYRGVLGFDVVSRWPGALFVSVGGYHHHFGLNTWQSAGGRPAPQDRSQLVRVNLGLPDPKDLDALAGRLHAVQQAFTRDAAHLDVRDPSGNALRFSMAPA